MIQRVQFVESAHYLELSLEGEFPRGMTRVGPIGRLSLSPYAIPKGNPVQELPEIRGAHWLNALITIGF